jgi:hypothetical protein
VLAQQGTQGDLKINTASDPNNPAVTFSVSPSVEFQWAVQPYTQPDLVTNWSFRAPTLTWYHVALVNDGKKTKLFINGSEDVRNSHELAVGLESTGQFWMVGATQYGDVVGPAFYGWLGDVRIVNRPLSVREFMISR